MARRQYSKFSDAQTEQLLEEFGKKQYPDRKKRIQLSQTLDVSEARIMIWFQNQRMKAKKAHPAAELSGYHAKAHAEHDNQANMQSGHQRILQMQSNQQQLNQQLNQQLQWQQSNQQLQWHQPNQQPQWHQPAEPYVGNEWMNDFGPTGYLNELLKTIPPQTSSGGSEVSFAEKTKATRSRTAFKDFQLAALEEQFSKSDTIEGEEKKALARRLGLTVDNIRYYFKNRRADKRKEARKRETRTPEVVNDRATVIRESDNDTSSTLIVQQNQENGDTKDLNKQPAVKMMQENVNPDDINKIPFVEEMQEEMASGETEIQPDKEVLGQKNEQPTTEPMVQEEQALIDMPTFEQFIELSSLNETENFPDKEALEEINKQPTVELTTQEKPTYLDMPIFEPMLEDTDTQSSGEQKYDVLIDDLHLSGDEEDDEED